MGREPSEIVRRELTAYRPNMLPPPSPPAKSPSPNRNPIAGKKVCFSRRLFPLGSAFESLQEGPKAPQANLRESKCVFWNRKSVFRRLRQPPRIPSASLRIPPKAGLDRSDRGIDSLKDA
jgi:hypothetical protein